MFRVAVLAVVATAACSAPLAVSAAGVGPVHAGTPVARDSLAALFPAYRATEAADESEGEIVGYVVTLSANGAPAMQIHGDRARKLVSVEVVSRGISAPYGLRVGTAFSQLQHLGAPQCERGTEERAGDVVCRLPGEPRVAYIGEVAELGARWNGADDEVPPPALLATMSIRAIAWLAP